MFEPEPPLLGLSLEHGHVLLILVRLNMCWLNLTCTLPDAGPLPPV